MSTHLGSFCLPLILMFILLLVLPLQSFALQVQLPTSLRGHVSQLRASQFQLHANQHNDKNHDDDNCLSTSGLSRRSAIGHATKSVLSTAAITTVTSTSTSSILTGFPNSANAAVGTLPEFSDANAILQGITITVSDSQQQQDMIAFLQDGFKMTLTRQRQLGSITDTWLAFGPEQMSIPDQWEPAVSSLASYGGHASIHIRYDSQTSQNYYNPNFDSGYNTSPAPGNNVAYLQLGVPEYRISQMVKTGGNVYNGYGIVEAISPSGLPIRGIIGIHPDPMMFLALNCKNVNESKEFYQQLGFVPQEYPYCRPNKGKGQFEPEQPKNSVYLAPSRNSFGILLLQADKKKVKNLTTNPVLQSMNVVYQPSQGTMVNVGNDGDSDADLLKVVDPSNVPIAFEPIGLFEKREQATRINVDANGGVS